VPKSPAEPLYRGRESAEQAYDAFTFALDHVVKRVFGAVLLHHVEWMRLLASLARHMQHELEVRIERTEAAGVMTRPCDENLNGHGLQFARRFSNMAGPLVESMRSVSLSCTMRRPLRLRASARMPAAPGWCCSDEVPRYFIL